MLLNQDPYLERDHVGVAHPELTARGFRRIVGQYIHPLIAGPGCRIGFHVGDAEDRVQAAGSWAAIQ